MKTRFAQNIWRGCGLFILLLCLWEGLYQTHIINRCLWPSVSDTARCGFAMLASGELQQHTAITLIRFGSGFIFGTVLALAVGFACMFSRAGAYLLEPLIYLTFTTPRFILLPFIIIFFGFGWFGGVLFLGLGAFYPMVITMIEGYRALNRHYVNVARHYGAQGWDLYRDIIFPGSLPAVFTGLRIGLGLTMTFTIILEYLNMSSGLGSLMWMALQTMQMDRLCVLAITVAVVNLCVIVLFAFLERKLAPWVVTTEEHAIYGQ
ncbi:MAG: ABC transporter permease [Candidatus Omnitrophica bacterium]|nr:ABC transporter permease [Candidatus Omnitrophota bacterium]